MDISAIARDVGTMLAPALPYLLHTGEKVSEGFLKQIGSDTWRKVTGVWTKLKDKLMGSAVGQEAVEMLAANPTDSDECEILILKVKQLLESDHSLATELLSMIQSPALQEVVASKGSWIVDVEQVGDSDAHQRVIADDRSVVKGVKQTKRLS